MCFACTGEVDQSDQRGLVVSVQAVRIAPGTSYVVVDSRAEHAVAATQVPGLVGAVSKRDYFVVIARLAIGICLGKEQDV